MNILVINDNSGPKYHRVLLPCFLMPGIEIKVEHFPTEESLHWADIVYFNRAIGKTNIPTDKYFAMARKECGVKFICDLDDHWLLDPTHTLYNYYKETGLSDIIADHVRASDYITVTHERLYYAAKQLNPNVMILPNSIPLWGQFTVKKRPSNVTRLFWAGSMTHVNDIELLRNPVKRLSGMPVKMVMGGYADNNQYKRMASAYTNGGMLPNQLIEGLPVLTYYHMYAECDISLIPLCDNSFNEYKSNLKILEAANIGAPVVVSKVNPYLEMDYVNYVESSGDWYRHIKRLVNAPGEAQYQGQRLKEYCAQRFNFIQINEQRKQLFEHVTGKH